MCAPATRSRRTGRIASSGPGAGSVAVAIRTATRSPRSRGPRSRSRRSSGASSRRLRRSSDRSSSARPGRAPPPDGRKSGIRAGHHVSVGPWQHVTDRTGMRNGGQDLRAIDSAASNSAGPPLGRTRSICPRCRAVLDAELLVRDGRVVLSRACPDHGEFEAVVYGDAERYLEIQRFNKPGESPRERQTEIAAGCPRDCGICPDHAQHTCLGIIEVNTACNLDCPICFADSGTGPQEHGYSLSLEQVESMLDSFVRAEGEPESVQLSGGEPSIHPQILEMLRAARDRGIQLVMLNTNGIRLARDPRFAPALADIGVHVYLQFDGFTDATQLAIRGRPLTEEKLRAVDRCGEAGVSVSLAVAVERGVNE